MTDLPSATRPDTLADYRRRVQRVLDHLRGRADDRYDLNEVARIACFSPFHFHRIFAAVTGETLGAHLRRQRIERAAERLTNSQDTVLRIAFSHGFESHEAFTRAFKAMLGVTPTAFRSLDESGRGALILRARPALTGGSIVNVEIKSLPPTKVAFIARTASYATAGEAFASICAWAGMRGLIRGPFTPIGVYYDDPASVPAEKCRFEACVPLTMDVKEEGEVKVRTIPGGRYAVLVHKGPYSQISATYTSLFRNWLHSSGEEARDEPCIERYLNNPQTTPEAELLTEVCLPLK